MDFVAGRVRAAWVMNTRIISEGLARIYQAEALTLKSWSNTYPDVREHTRSIHRSLLSGV